MRQLRHCQKQNSKIFWRNLLLRHHPY